MTPTATPRDADVREMVEKLTEDQKRAFLTISSDQWHRRPYRDYTPRGRLRDFDRIQKCKRLGLIEHRVNMGAEYRLTPLGLALRRHLMEKDNG